MNANTRKVAPVPAAWARMARLIRGRNEVPTQNPVDDGTDEHHRP